MRFETRAFLARATACLVSGWVLTACSRGSASPPEMLHTAADGTVVVAAMMPACGCLSLTNLRDSATAPNGGSADIEIVASFRGQDRGTIVIGRGQAHTEAFDWAGPAIQDGYSIAAYARGTDGSRGARLTPIGRYVRFVARPAACTAHEEPSCAFGPLGLDAAIGQRAPQ